MDFDMDVDLFGDNDGNDGNDAQDYSVYESADEKSRIKTSSPGEAEDAHEDAGDAAGDTAGDAAGDAPGILDFEPEHKVSEQESEAPEKEAVDVTEMEAQEPADVTEPVSSISQPTEVKSDTDPNKDKTDAEQPIEDNLKAEQLTDDKQELEQPIEEKLDAEQSIEDNLNSEQPTDDKQEVEQPIEDSLNAEQPAENKPEVEQPTEDKQDSEQPNDNKSDVELQDDATELPTGREISNEQPIEDRADEQPNEERVSGDDGNEFKASDELPNEEKVSDDSIIQEKASDQQITEGIVSDQQISKDKPTDEQAQDEITDGQLQSKVTDDQISQDMTSSEQPSLGHVSHEQHIDGPASTQLPTKEDITQEHTNESTSHVHGITSNEQPKEHSPTEELPTLEISNGLPIEKPSDEKLSGENPVDEIPGQDKNVQDHTTEDVKMQDGIESPNDLLKEEKDEAQLTGSPATEGEQASNDSEYALIQTHEIVIPSYSKWFDLRKIHEIEKKSLPEFFTNRIPSKTPQVYLKYRNFMVNAYRLNPNEYFTVTAARRNVSGDAAALFRIHKFLTKWGIINYQVDAKVLPKNVEPPFTGDYSTRHDAPRGLFPFESYKPSVQLPDMAKLKKMMDVNDSESALYRYLKEEKRKFIEGKIENSVHHKQHTKTEVKKENQDEKNTESTEQQTAPAHHEGQERSSLKRSSEAIFNEEHKLKKPKILDHTDEEWSREDLQKLLDGMQKHGVDWYKVASEIGNKTPEQCILKFLQLPIEDKFLYNGEGGKDLGPIKFAPHLPFSKSENPILSTIAFLVGMVDPQIVKNMTSRAIQRIEDVHEQNLKNTKSDAKEGSEIAIASLGVRSGVYANNEEKHLHALSHELVQIQLQKLDSNLELLNQMEKSFDLEKRMLEKQQESLLLQRLQIAKNARSVMEIATKILEDADDKEALKKDLEVIRDHVMDPPTPSLATPGDSKSSTEPKEVKPVSIEVPQYYRYWSA